MEVTSQSILTTEDRESGEKKGCGKFAENHAGWGSYAKEGGNFAGLLKWRILHRVSAKLRDSLDKYPFLRMTKIGFYQTSW